MTIRSKGPSTSAKPQPCTAPRSANRSARSTAFRAVRLAISNSAGHSPRKGSSTPRTAPPAPSRRTRLPRSSTPAFAVRSRSRPAPSVLSPRRRPSARRIRVFTAPARVARSLNSSTRR
ncbi:Uncharacterised protein [Acinetobacter baumannii]|nr:Uncharacterised protein [Acinetobacter baumannii]